MSNQPLVSVVITYLNEERFLREAIESVLAQTYEKWELLLVDDGSTDASAAIGRGYAEEHPGKVHYLEHPGRQNRGMSASRNLGMANGTGEYIALLDADDVWLPHKLERQVAELESRPEVGMVFGLSQWWYSWSGNQDDSLRDFVHHLGVAPDTVLQPPSLLDQFFLKKSIAIPNPSDILIRRIVAENVGGFEENFKGIYASYEDQAFYAKVGLSASVLAIDECWDRYRQHPDSTTANVKRKGREHETRLFFLNWLQSYLDERGFDEREIRLALKKEIQEFRYPILHYTFETKRRFTNWETGILWRLGRKTIPAPIRVWLWSRWQGHEYSPPAGWVRFGSLRRLSPFSRDYGFDRGLPIDRYYIEKFLSEHEVDIRGHVLEIADDGYTRRFGQERVTRSDVLHVAPGNPQATIVGDLSSANHILSDSFDCVILTQTLQVIYDVRAAIRTLHRILKPGGVALVTVPGISPVSGYDQERWGYFWSFTVQSARRLFEEFFPPDCVQVRNQGNVLTATAFLYGMAAEELERRELEYIDLDYQLIITIWAMKPGLRARTA